jgi:hypothetical protein
MDAARDALRAAQKAEKAATNAYLLFVREELGDIVGGTGEAFVDWLEPVLKTAHGIEITRWECENGTLTGVDTKGSAGLDAHRALANLLAFYCEVTLVDTVSKDTHAYTRLKVSYF